MYENHKAKVFSDEEKDIICDAIDIYGFDAIYYVVAADYYVVLYHDVKYANIDGPEVVKYLEERIGSRKWAYGDYPTFNSRIANNGYEIIFIFDYYGWEAR